MSPFEFAGKVEPGRLPIGIDLAATATAILGFASGRFIFGCLRIRFNQKVLYGIALSMSILGTFAQSISIGSSPNVVIGSLCFWRFVSGFGIGGDSKLVTEVMYNSSVTYIPLIGLIFAAQGLGIVAAAAVTSITIASVKGAFPLQRFPSNYEQYCPTSIINDMNTWDRCINSGGAQVYFNAIKASCPPSADIVW
jgi:PHS family inorganic phosphate transporter-like MFS transporter